MRGMRRTHISVEGAAEILSAQPDITIAVPPSVERKPVPKYALFEDRSPSRRRVEKRRYPRRGG